MKFPKRFFKRIFRNILRDHHLDLEVRCLNQFRDEDSFWPKQFWCKSLAELQGHWPEIEELNLKGYDIHFTVVARRRKFQGKKEHPLPDKPYFACLWADLDVGKGKPYRKLKEAFRALRDGQLPPDTIVESGSGLHAYYLLREPCAITKERVEALLGAITSRLHGDKGAARATRLMRVPNTYNWKTGTKKLARVRYFPRMGYRLKDLEAQWKPITASDGPKHKRHMSNDDGKYAVFFGEHLKRFVLPNGSTEAMALCPFHDDHHPSFSVNVTTGHWKCWGADCGAKGDLTEFCRRKRISVPVFAIQRFPRLRDIPEGEEWSSEKLFGAAYGYVTRQIHFTQSWQPVLVTLWAMGTYLYKQFPCYGHLWLNSPTTHSGKTKLLDVLWTLCYKSSAPQLEPTPASLFRFPSAIGGTLLLDEIDNLDPEKRSAVISVLNSYNSNGEVVRAVPGKNKKFTLEKLRVYCPKVIAGINNLPTTLQDRCIKIYLHRKKESEKVERFMPGSHEALESLRKQLDAWAVRAGVRIKNAYNDRDHLGIPAAADDRAKDILEPLFAVARVLPEWVTEKLIDGSLSIAAERKAEEAESNIVVLGVQILTEHFPQDTDRWHVRTDTAFELFSEAIPSIETKAQAQALMRRLGFKSVPYKDGSKVLRAYKVPLRRLEKLSERYGLRQNVA